MLAGSQGGPGTLRIDLDRVLLQHPVLQAQVEALPAARKRDACDRRAAAALLLPSIQQQGGREGRAPVGVHGAPQLPLGVHIDAAGHQAAREGP